MIAISLWQPWATLVAIDAKRNETRSWFRGPRPGHPLNWPIAIHATVGFPAEAQALVMEEPFRSVLGTAFPEAETPKQLAELLPRGAVVATAVLRDIVAVESVVRGLTRQERAFGDYSPDRYAWRLDNIERLSQPIPARGGRGLWQWERPGFEAVPSRPRFEQLELPS